jgi:hypothetical protein
MPSQNISILSLTLKANGNVAAYRAVKANGAQATVQGEKVIGVAEYAANSGKDVPVAVIGTAKVEAGAAFAVGASLIVDNQGRAIAKTGNLAIAAGGTTVTSSAANGEILTGADFPEYVFADALEAAGQAGDIVEVLLRR